MVENVFFTSSASLDEALSHPTESTMAAIMCLVPWKQKKTDDPNPFVFSTEVLGGSNQCAKAD